MGNNTIFKNTIVRRLMYLILFIVIWQILYLLKVFPEILFPSPFLVSKTFLKELFTGTMLIKTSYSLIIIVEGLLISIAAALFLVIFSMLSKGFKDIIKMLISIMDPLPGITLLPLAILWVGIGEAAIIFVMIHSILWPIVLNVITGFESVPKIYKDVGNNIGLSKLKLIWNVYVPASLPNILIGLKTGWARAWRALISAEMVFGATGVTGGLGWDIYLKRSYLDMPGMLSTMLVIMIIGIIIEDLLFVNIEKSTIKKWGMIHE